MARARRAAAEQWKKVEIANVSSAQCRPNNLSSSQESSPPPLSGRALGGSATGAGGEGAGAPNGAANGAPNQPGSDSPGSGAGASLESAERMKRLQISTGTPPPTACLVGVLSSLASQTPATSRDV